MNEIAGKPVEESGLRLNTPQMSLSGIQTLIDRIAAVSSGKIVLGILVCLSTVFLAVQYVGLSTDPDIWWQLAYGKHFVTNLTTNIDHNQFGWTVADKEWHYVNWLSSSILYVIYTAFSYGGLKIFQLMLYLSIALLFLRFLKSASVRLNPIHVLGFLMIFMAATPVARILKPEMFTTLSFNVILLLYFLTKVTQRNYFKYMPLVFLIWVNCHGGYIGGFILLGLLFVGEVFNLALRRDTALSRRLLWWMFVGSGISVLVVNINPSGFSYLYNMVIKLASMDQQSGLQYITAMINRWQFLFPKHYQFLQVHTAWLLVLMVSTFLVATVFALVRKRVVDLALLLSNIAFFLMAMKMGRAVIYFPFLWIYSLTYLAWRTGFRVPNRANLVTIPLMLALIITGSWALETCLGHKMFARWSHDEILPVTSVDFVRQHEPPGPIFNDYSSGAYLIWALYPQYEVFIDPRYQPYFPDVWNDYIKLRRNATMENFRELVSKYHFKTAIINHVISSNLNLVFNRAEDWEAVFIDKVCTVYVKREANTKEFLDRITTSPDADGFTDVGKFKDLQNWRIIWGLYLHYLSHDINSARQLYFVFEENVADTMRHKQAFLDQMNKSLAQSYSDRRREFPIMEVPNLNYF